MLTSSKTKVNGVRQAGKLKSRYILFTLAFVPRYCRVCHILLDVFNIMPAGLSRSLTLAVRSGGVAVARSISGRLSPGGNGILCWPTYVNGTSHRNKFCQVESTFEKWIQMETANINHLPGPKTTTIELEVASNRGFFPEVTEENSYQPYLIIPVKHPLLPM